MGILEHAYPHGGHGDAPVAGRVYLAAVYGQRRYAVRCPLGPPGSTRGGWRQGAVRVSNGSQSPIPGVQSDDG